MGLNATGLWRKRVGVEITVNLQIDRVYAALRTPTSLQSLLNITVLQADGKSNPPPTDGYINSFVEGAR